MSSVVNLEDCNVAANVQLYIRLEAMARGVECVMTTVEAWSSASG